MTHWGSETERSNYYRFSNETDKVCLSVFLSKLMQADLRPSEDVWGLSRISLLLLLLLNQICDSNRVESELNNLVIMTIKITRCSH